MQIDERARPAELVKRITTYLATGGLFNPELINPYIVRDILLDCRDALAASQPQAEAAGAARHVDDMNDLVLMGLARDAAEARLKIAMEALGEIAEEPEPRTEHKVDWLWWKCLAAEQSRIARDAKAKIEALP